MGNLMRGAPQFKQSQAAQKQNFRKGGSTGQRNKMTGNLPNAQPGMMANMLRGQKSGFGNQQQMQGNMQNALSSMVGGGSKPASRPSYRDAIQAKRAAGEGQQGTTGADFFGMPQQQAAPQQQQMDPLSQLQANKAQMDQQANQSQGMDMQGYQDAQQRQMQRQMQAGQQQQRMQDQRMQRRQQGPQNWQQSLANRMQPQAPSQGRMPDYQAMQNMGNQFQQNAQQGNTLAQGGGKGGRAPAPPQQAGGLGGLVSRGMGQQQQQMGGKGGRSPQPQQFRGPVGGKGGRSQTPGQYMR